MIFLPNTFGLKSFAKDQLLVYDSIKFVPEKWFILGSASNSVLDSFIDATCIRAANNSIKLQSQNDDFVLVKVGAAIEWDKLVSECASNNWHGLENLALIPGTVGAAPIQNIGAYGTEIAKYINKVNTICLAENKRYSFNNHECEFDYRTSIFKNKLKTHLITDIELKLETHFNIVQSHGAFKNANNMNHFEVIDFIKKTRTKKLPCPKVHGNAGSFFKNPIVDKELANKLHSIPSFQINEQQFKISAAALIEQADLKGLSHAGAQVSTQHALVIINNSNTDFNAIYELKNKIQAIVLAKYNIKLETEVRFINQYFLQQYWAQKA